jgi:hypothetical protein
VGVIYDFALNELRLFTDCGRTSRPLFIVGEGNTLAFTRDHLRALLDRYSAFLGLDMVVFCSCVGVLYVGSVTFSSNLL